MTNCHRPIAALLRNITCLLVPVHFEFPHHKYIIPFLFISVKLKHSPLSDVILKHYFQSAYFAPYRSFPMRPDSLLRFWRYINWYLLTYICHDNHISHSFHRNITLIISLFWLIQRKCKKLSKNYEGTIFISLLRLSTPCISKLKPTPNICGEIWNVEKIIAAISDQSLCLTICVINWKVVIYVTLCIEIYALHVYVCKSVLTMSAPLSFISHYCYSCQAMQHAAGVV